MDDDFSARYTTSRLQKLSIVVAVAFLVCGLVFPPPADLSREALITLGVFGFGLVLWQSKAIPLVATSLLVVGLLYAFGVTESFQAATIGFASTLFFFFFTILLLGHSISKVDLDAHVAQRLLETSTTPQTSLHQLGKYLLVMAFVVPSGLARIVSFTPVIEKVGERYGLGRDAEFTTASFLVLGQLNPMMSIMLMTGGGISIIGSQLIDTAGYPITWTEWALYMIPPTLIVFGLGFAAITKLHPPRTNASQLPDTNHRDTSQSQLNRDQRIVAIVMGVTLLLWAVGSFVGLPTVLPAILAVAALSAPYVQVLTVEDFAEISWGILFLIGAMLSLIEVLEETGAFEWLIDGISMAFPFDAVGSVGVVALLIAIVVIVRLLFPNASTSLIVLMPMIISFGQLYDVNVLYLSLSVVITVGSTALLPIHMPPALLAYNAGYVSIRDVFGYGLVMMAAAVLSICFAWTIYWPILEHALLQP
ncbi:SLC13 family permease [Natrialbaceae archaeon AArc-T1-2]|uniref:SLC13 family permease n=1 Tax=Natrialbaceae archaeon AArc-T1-2 TaxID=3053904 RepID=UPI00255AE1E1|nr:SLC13 family permease [Natrialbaceae archaeon AArc-T1-2]WIV67600.1 anion permease [Natrialbaceae archaeon AArc-T1-2]